MVAATQPPSADVVPTSLRDLFGYRWAFRCTTDASSDTILGHGWANLGYTATDIDPLARGVGWLLAGGSTPRRHREANAGRRTNSNNGVSAACACGRRIRVAPSTYEAGHLVCGSEFTA